LLASGPLVGVLWAAVLLGQPAWVWSIPTPVRVLAGATLVAVVALLVVVTRIERIPYRRREPAVRTAALLVAALDLSVCALVLTPGSGQARVVQLAVAASLLRCTALATSALRGLALVNIRRS